MLKSLFVCDCHGREFISEKALRAHKAFKATQLKQQVCCTACKRIIRVCNWHQHESKCYGTGTYVVWNAGKTVVNNPELADKIKAGGTETAKKIKSGELKPALAAYWQSEERRKEKSEWRKKLHRENPDTHPNRRLANNRNRMSYPEQLVFDLLTELGLDFQHNPKIDKFFPDFVIGKQIIEVDGAQWHDAERDAIRDARLNELGYSVERFVVGRNKDLLERVKAFLVS